MRTASHPSLEDGHRKHLSRVESVSVVYVLLCVAGGTASALIDLPFVSGWNLVLLIPAFTLLLVALVVLAARVITRERALVVLGSSVLSIGLMEATVRMFGSSLGIDEAQLEDYRAFVRGEWVKFEPSAHLGFTRPHGGRGYNSQGFSDDEWSRAREPGVLRIACLGGSTTEGGNPLGARGAYPTLLEAILEERTGRDFDVMNCGVSGWTTAESMIAWFLIIQDFDPDLVLVHHAVNDVNPRNESGFRRDYSHWRRSWERPTFHPLHRFLVRASSLYAGFMMKNVPDVGEISTHRSTGPHPFFVTGALPSETAEPYRRNIESIGNSAAGHGAQVALMTMPIRPQAEEPDDNMRVFRYGILDHNGILRQIARDNTWLLIDAEYLTETNPEFTESVFIDNAHLTKAGNSAKAALACEVLMSSWLPALEKGDR